MTPKHYLRNLTPTYQTFCTGSNPAAVTKSIGLPAIAQVSRFLQCRFDNFIMTQYSVPSTVPDSYRDGKNLATATLTATNQTAGPLYLSQFAAEREILTHQ
jgi:hypothetical protein